MNVIDADEVMIAPDGKLITRFPLSVMIEHVPDVVVKLLPVPDLSDHVVHVDPVPVAAGSAESNHNEHPGMDVGKNGTVAEVGIE